MELVDKIVVVTGGASGMAAKCVAVLSAKAQSKSWSQIEMATVPKRSLQRSGVLPWR